MRIFYAIDIDENTKNEIRKKTEQIGSLITTGRIIDPFNYHITLEYVGEVDKRELDYYCGILKEAAGDTPSSNIAFSGISSFRRDRAHLIFLKGEAQKEAEVIRQRIISFFSGEKKPFLPHITICRDALLKKGVDIDDIAYKIGYEPITVKADNISLMESSLINGKLVYITLYNIKLKQEIVWN